MTAATLEETGDKALADRPIALIGFMGVGKTSAGRNLAHALAYGFLDTDRLVEQAVGMSVARIFRTQGELEFRRQETLALREALSKPRRVVSTGGGLPLLEENRRALREGAAVVLLTAAPEVILQRVRPLKRRPLLAQAPDPLQRIKDMLQERMDIYREYDFALDTSELHPRKVAELILGWYRTQQGAQSHG
ncbi:MAG: shikimate kinase [Armatimonadetes bacterium]|nr:shikimate kinase [Armatimonadota bacterium]